MYQVFLKSFFLLKLIVNSTVTFLMDDKRFTEVHTQNRFINTQRCYKTFTVLDHLHTKFRDLKVAKFFPILYTYCNISITPTERQMRFIRLQLRFWLLLCIISKTCVTDQYYSYEVSQKVILI